MSSAFLRSASISTLAALLLAGPLAGQQTPAPETPKSEQGPAAPEPGLFRHIGALNGVIGERQQIRIAEAVEVRQERTELIAEHALRQTELTRFVIGGIGFFIAFKVDEVTAEVEPGERVVWGGEGIGLGGEQAVLPIQVRVPVGGEQGLDLRFLLWQKDDQLK